MAGFSFGTPTTTAPSFSFGNTTSTGGAPGINFGSPAPNPATTTLQFNTPGHSSGSVTFAAPAATTGGGLTFGSPGGLNLGTPAASQGALSFKPGGLGGGLNFGSAPTQQPSLTFGSAVTTTPVLPTFGSASTANQQTLSFGSTPATSQPLSFGSTPAQPQSLSFGSTPATSQPLSFGSTPATSQPLSFGSTPATSQPLSFGSTAPSQPLNFGSTPATSQPLSFGSTPATAQPLSFGSTPATSQPLSFGSTPATSQPLSFGSTTATAQPLSFGSTLGTTQTPLNLGATPSTSQPLNFGSTLGSTQPGLSFGTTPTTTQARLTPATSQPLTFGAPAPATTTGGLSFGLGGQPAVTKPTVSFGLSTTTPAATTAATLLNFSAPKTSSSAGFSLTVSTGTGTGTLFSVPTTSAVTTAAPPVFKGLGGIDTSTTQGSGQKDAKSVKENTVFPELMPTLDTLKNFVKQQKSLSCEVSRAPVKPMHKVTEDTEALRQMLTSVASALQKNRVVANKLKIDTTKCLALCEMAQRTHDTPPGLQNDNVAPLEFFVELVSKFERDIQVLRQEIDNTEKHVNSLAYPAILTPQELSVALRRLHDSFVALAGRLQTAHSGVIAQKERHLSLRRHFLKDTTNIFENSSKAAASTKKQQYINILPMTGPTPFSSLSGGHNINLMTGQDKPVTFSTGTNSISNWGSSAATNLNIAASPNFLNTTGSTALNNQQAVENQNFQLGKPPPGNKRGKR